MASFRRTYEAWDYEASWSRGERSTILWSAVVRLGGGIRGRPNGTIHRAPATDENVDDLVSLAVETAIDGGVGVELPFR